MRLIAGNAGGHAPAAAYVGVVVIVAAFALAAACGHPLLPRWSGLAWSTAAGISQPVIAVWAVAFLLLGLAIMHPAFGLAGYVLCAYSIQGTEAAYQMLYRDGGLHWVALLAVIAGVLWQLRRDLPLRLPREPLALAVFAFLAWVALCFVVAQFAGRDAPPRWNREPAYFLHCLAVFWLTASFVRGREWLIALTVLIAAVLVYRWLIAPAVIFNESYLASYLAITCPLVLALSLMFEGIAARLLCLCATLAMIALILHIQNRAAVAASIVAMFVFVLVSLSRLRATMLSIVLLLVVVFGLPRTQVWERFGDFTEHLSPGTERVALWYGGLAMFREHPVFGVGPGQYSSAVPLYTDGIGRGGQPDAHNSFVEVLAETGAPGLLLFCWMLVVALGYAYQVAASERARGWVRGAGRGIFASLWALIVVSMLNSRHDLALVYIVFGMACSVRASWLARRSAVG